MIHISLDLETWGVKPGCDIRAIGAYRFDHSAPVFEVREENCFYVAAKNPVVRDDMGYFDGIGAYRRYRLTREQSTVDWWCQQSAEAQAAFENAIDLRAAISRFSGWFKTVVGNSDPQSVRIWTNGPQFDISILAAVYDVLGREVPWHYRAPRCFRTITEAAGLTMDQFCNYGVAHNCLDDSIAQANTIWMAQRTLELRRIWSGDQG